MMNPTLSQTDLGPAASPASAHAPRAEEVLAAIQKRSFATLSTVSGAGRPHVAGVLYEAVGTTLYVSTLRSSRKARNVAESPHVALVIPIRRIPVGPPSTVMFQGRGEVLDVDAPEITALVAEGRLASITSHGELELADGCFVRITPPRRWLTYGLGMSLWNLLRDPIGAGGSVEMDAAS